MRSWAEGELHVLPICITDGTRLLRRYGSATHVQPCEQSNQWLQDGERRAILFVLRERPLQQQFEAAHGTHHATIPLRRRGPGRDIRKWRRRFTSNESHDGASTPRHDNQECVAFPRQYDEDTGLSARRSRPRYWGGAVEPKALSYLQRNTSDLG